jgi:hypothetical protein
MKHNRLLAGMLAIAMWSVSVQAGYVWAQGAQGKQQPAADQSGKSDKATKGRGGADPNIKAESATNTPGQEPAAPPKKGGAQGRGIFDCWVDYDNNTPWYIQVYADGNFRGTVGPWGNLTVNVGAGITKVYGRATFTDGTVLTWGPQTFNCASNGVVPWHLTR